MLRFQKLSRDEDPRPPNQEAGARWGQGSPGHSTTSSCFSCRRHRGLRRRSCSCHSLTLEALEQGRRALLGQAQRLISRRACGDLI